MSASRMGLCYVSQIGLLKYTRPRPYQEILTRDCAGTLAIPLVASAEQAQGSNL